MADEGELEGLLSKARAGDRDCLVSLLDHLGAEVRRRIEPKISPRQRSSLDADDVMQVTYLEAVLQFGGFRDGGVSALRAWLTRLAQNNLIDAIRALEAAKRSSPSQRVSAAPGQDSALVLVELLGATYTTPSRAAARREADSFIEQALAKIPSDYADVIRLYDLEQRPIAEVAQHLGRTEGAVYMLRARAHDRLREALGTESMFFSRPA